MNYISKVNKEFVENFVKSCFEGFKQKVNCYARKNKEEWVVNVLCGEAQTHEFTFHLKDFTAEVKEIRFPRVEAKWRYCLCDKFGTEYLQELNGKYGLESCL